VMRVDRDGAGFAVEYTGGVQRTRAVVVAIPPPALRTVTLPVDTEGLDILRQVGFLPSVRLNLGYERAGILDPLAITPAGMGDHPVIGIGAISAWMHGAAPAGKEVVRISASGWRSEALLGLPTPQVVDGLLSDCRALGIHLPAHDWVEVFEERHAIVRTPPGHFMESRRFGRCDRGGLHFAGDWLTGSTIEGAVRSGEAAAARTIAAVRAIRSGAVVCVT
jgi:predicted NAD/FAD-dependent oxidoreductase